MRAITPELAAILKSRLQAGPDGFHARVEVGGPVVTYPHVAWVYVDHWAGAPLTTCTFEASDDGVAWTTIATGAELAAGTTDPPDGAGTIVGLVRVPAGQEAHRYWRLSYADETTGGYYGGIDISGIRLLDPGGDGSVCRLGTPSLFVWWGLGSGGGDISFTVATTGYATAYGPADQASRYGISAGVPPAGTAGATWTFELPAVAGAAPSYQPKRVSIDKSLRMAADQATIEFPNEGLPLGWGPESIFPTNCRVRVYQWYSDPENEVLTFTGIVDEIADSRDPLTTVITCRDLMALLLDQTFGAIAPQGADEAGADRTTDNGVYLDTEVSVIVEDILDRAGWPSATREVFPTSYTVAEYLLDDGATWSETIDGPDKLTGLVGYRAWVDEAGVFHFAPTLEAGSLSSPVDPVYTFRAGEDLTRLDDTTDHYDLRTRVKVRGPLTKEVLTDTWRQIWTTRKLRYPTSVWYNPAEATIIRVLDRGTKKMYRIRLSDRAVLGSTYLGGVIPYPLALSGDPSDATIYWVLNAPWHFTGSTTGNSIKKVRKSDRHVIASYSLPSGRWSGLKAGSTHLWLTNLDTDRLYKRTKTGGAVDDWHHVISGVTQTNPTGLTIDGSTISVFWTNGGKTPRFAVCDAATPGTVDKIVKTAGTTFRGGEMDTTTHQHMFACSDDLGLLGKYQLLVASEQTDQVFAEVVDTELEDELGSLVGTEPRYHDSHILAAPHAYEVRRDTVDLAMIVSLAQATETAMRRLEDLARRRRVLDAGILGNPAIQKTDLVRIEDPVTGLASDWLVDTYRTEMTADGTYLGTLALLPVEQPEDVPEDDGTATDDTVTGYWPMLALTSDSR